jgi:2-polyprenyl-6-methoxyphenol hydroxylase-like FAD-dependent oxidoreductase
VHAGIGARGLNLGGEDAYVFATLYDAAHLSRYNALRGPTVRKVVRQIRRAMGPPRPATLAGKVVRAAPWMVPLVLSAIRDPAQRWILGLDHDLAV